MSERERKLPMVEGTDGAEGGTAPGDARPGSGSDAESPAAEQAHAAGGPGGPGGAGSPGGPGAPRKIEASAARLVSTLTLAGALAGLVIVLVHQWSQPRIEAHQARVLQEAIFEVLGGPERYETAFLVNGGFTTTPPPEADTSELERVYVGYDEGGRAVGVAVAGAKAGFQDVIRLIFGYHPARGEVTGMKVLESKETPGLGDKIEKDSAFVDEFAGAGVPLEGVKAGAGDGTSGEVDMITGATISSRAVIDIINLRLDALGPSLRDFWGAGAVAGRIDGSGRVEDAVERTDGPASAGTGAAASGSAATGAAGAGP